MNGYGVDLYPQIPDNAHLAASAFIGCEPTGRIATDAPPSIAHPHGNRPQIPLRSQILHIVLDSILSDASQGDDTLFGALLPNHCKIMLSLVARNWARPKSKSR